MSHTEQSLNQTVTHRYHDAILIALELSTKSWLVASREPESEKISKHVVKAGDGSGLLLLLAKLKGRAEERLGRKCRLITIQEAGLDGFWIHRLLESEGIESHVVDAASIAAPRRGRRAKTDKIDVDGLLRTLSAWLRGEPRICSMVRPPSPEEEDRKRLERERKVLLKERVSLTNRIRGLLKAQGISGFNPLGRNRRKLLQTLATADGHVLPVHLTRQIDRTIGRLELLLVQIKQNSHERDEELSQAPVAAKLCRLKSIGPNFAAMLWFEAFYRDFANQRKISAYSGLAATPWRSGGIEREQGISKAGNPRLRETMVELAWLWLQHQPKSALSQWFFRRVGKQKGKIRRIAIVALARKLLVALWRYSKDGIVPEGAVFKTV
jgi:transposase